MVNVPSYRKHYVASSKIEIIASFPDPFRLDISEGQQHAKTAAQTSVNAMLASPSSAAVAVRSLRSSLRRQVTTTPIIMSRHGRRCFSIGSRTVVLYAELPYHLVVGLPALSPTMHQGTLSEWYVKEGDAFSAGDAIAKIETVRIKLELVGPRTTIERLIDHTRCVSCFRSRIRPPWTLKRKTMEWWQKFLSRQEMEKIVSYCC
jgi:biotin carboxyl carrier protein